MEIKRIEGATKTYGAPEDWKEDETGKCYGLPVLEGVHAGMPVMISAWEPSPYELQQLIAGETIKLWIYGTSHPVVSLSVGPVEKATE